MKLRLISAVAFLVLLSWTRTIAVLHGQEEGWVSIGPPSGTVYALAIDPHDASVVYAGTNGGVFKSTDAGATWSPVNGGLPQATAAFGNGGPYIRSLAIDPQHSATVYAGVSFFGDELFAEPRGRGVYRSDNGGETWYAANAGMGFHIPWALAIDPATPTTLYAIGQIGPNGDTNIFKSTDGGASWSVGVPMFGPLAIDPLAPATVYAGIFKTTNGGTTWARMNVPGIGALAINPSDSSIVYAAGGGGVLKSTDAGSSWAAVNTGLTGSSVRALAIDRQSPATVYAGLQDGTIFKTINEGATWIPVTAGLEGSRLNSLAVDPETPGTVYAATEWKGVFKTVNGGDQWSHTSLSTIRVFSIAVDSTAATTFVGADRGGIYTRSGEGDWTSPPDPGTFYGPANPVAALAIDPFVPTTAYALVGFSSLIKTTDGGATWRAIPRQQTDQGLFRAKIRSLAVDPQTPDTLYIASGAAIYMSMDGGANWTVTTEALPNFGEVRALAIDPQITSTMYAGSSSGVFKSTDGGAGWFQSSNGLPGREVLALVVHPNVPSIVFAGIYRDGVFKSVDSGASWSPMDDQPPNLFIRALAMDAGSATLYAGTDGAGVFSIAAPARFPLTVTTTGHGFGTVVSIPEGIDCGSACTGEFAAGATVMLTATPATGVVKGWTGCDSDTGPGRMSTCTVAIVAARSVSVRVVGAPQVPPGRANHLLLRP